MCDEACSVLLAFAIIKNYCVCLRYCLLHVGLLAVDGKSPGCVICMKYRIRILIIIIISLGQILSSDLQTHHARTHTRAHTIIAVQVVAVRWRPPMMELTHLFAGFAGDHWPVAASSKFKQSRGRLGFGDSFWCFTRIQNKIARPN